MNSKIPLVGANITSFEVGEYNIELSRGSLGAYIRLPSQFQIWLASIELIDLDMDYHYWTYANLWNLQFGRFSQINNSSDSDYIATIVSLFLNTPLSSSLADITTLPILSLTADGEYFGNLIFNFYKQDEKYYVQFIFNDVKNNSVLQSFATKTKDKIYHLSTLDMEKINDAVNSRPGL